MAKTKTKKALVASEPKQVYISISGVGTLDSKGKVVMFYGFSGRSPAPADKMLQTLVPRMIGTLHEYLGGCYTDVKAAKSDLAALKKMINSLHINPEKN